MIRRKGHRDLEEGPPQQTDAARIDVNRLATERVRPLYGATHRLASTGSDPSTLYMPAFTQNGSLHHFLSKRNRH